MVTILRRASIIIASMLLVFSLCSCSAIEYAKIAGCLNSFAGDCKNGEFIDALDYVKPSVLSQSVKAIASLVPEQAEQFIAELITDDSGDVYVLSDFHLKDMKIDIYHSSADVHCVMCYDSDDLKVEKDCTIEMEKVQDTWYISGFSLD